MSSITKIVLTACFGLFFSLSLMAQDVDGPPMDGSMEGHESFEGHRGHHGHHGPRGHRGNFEERMERMKAELDLTEDQVAQLEELHEARRAEMKSLRQGGERPSQEVMKAKRQEHKAAMQEILTEEQFAKMKEMKREHKSEARKVMKEHKQAFRSEVLPLVMEQRAKFETMLSEADKQQIDQLRGELEALKPQLKELRKEKKQAHKAEAEPSAEMMEQFKALREQKKAIMTSAVKIAQNYESELKALHEEIKPQMEEFHTKMKEQHQGFRPENGKAPGCETKKGECKKGRKAQGASGNFEEMEGQGHHQKHRLRKVAQFVLMDPNGTAPGAGGTIETPELEIFPNPSVSNNTLTYQVKTPGQVTIDLLNKDGQVLKNVFNGRQEAGSYDVQVQTQDLKMDVYYYRVTTADNSAMKRFTVVKQ